MPAPDRLRPAHLQLLAVAWNFGWPVAAGVVLGHWIDESLGSSPAATLTFGIGSMAAATWRLLSLSRQESAERSESEAADAAARGQEPRARPGADANARRDPEPEPWPDDAGSLSDEADPFRDEDFPSEAELWNDDDDDDEPWPESAEDDGNDDSSGNPPGRKTGKFP